MLFCLAVTLASFRSVIGHNLITEDIEYFHTGHPGAVITSGPCLNIDCMLLSYFWIGDA